MLRRCDGGWLTRSAVRAARCAKFAARRAAAAAMVLWRCTCCSCSAACSPRCVRQLRSRARRRYGDPQGQGPLNSHCSCGNQRGRRRSGDPDGRGSQGGRCPLVGKGCLLSSAAFAGARPHSHVVRMLSTTGAVSDSCESIYLMTAAAPCTAHQVSMLRTMCADSCCAQALGTAATHAAHNVC